MYIDGRMRFRSAMASAWRRGIWWLPRWASWPAQSDDDDDNDALRPFYGVLVGVAVGVLCWVVIFLVLLHLGVW